MKRLLILLFIGVEFFANAQTTKPNYFTPVATAYEWNWGRFKYGFRVPTDTLPTADSGSIAYKNGVWYGKTQYWAALGVGGSGGDSSLFATRYWAYNTFQPAGSYLTASDLTPYYTKTQINSFYSGVTPISGYNKANWDAVYSAYAAVQALSPAGWATQSALVDTAAALRSIISGAGSGDMTKAVYDANNNGIVDVLELTGVVIGNGTSSPTAISGTANQLLRRNAANTAYEFFTPSYLTSAITSFNGLTGGTQTLALDTTYSGATSWSSVGTAHTLRLNRRLFDTNYVHSSAYNDARYQPIGSYLTGNQTISFSPTGDVTGSTTGTTTLAPALTIGNGKVTNSMLAGSIALSKLSITGTPDGTKFLRDDGSWQTVSGGGGTWGSITGTLNSQTDLRDSLRNRYISVRAINDTSWAYRKWNGTTYVEDTLVISLANGDKGDITVNSGWTNWTIDNGAVTDSKLSTGINANKIADGSVSSTEFQYINSVTSNVQTQLDGKQATLLSGTSIKTINGTSLLGSGNISITGGSGSTNDFRILPFQIDSTTNGPVAGASYFVLPSTMSTSKRIFFYREGELQHDTTGGVKNYQYLRHNDTIFVYPNLYTTERCLVQAYPDSNWTVDAFPAPPSFDVDAQAYMTAQETVDGITLSTSDKNAINQLFLDLKAGSNPFAQGKALYLFYGSTVLNALSPTNDDAHFRASKVNGPTIGSTGITLDGVDDYLNTHLNPSTTLANQSESYAWYNGIDANTGCDIGVYVGSSGTALFSRNSGNFLMRIQQSGDINTGANATSNGRYVLSLKSADIGSGTYNRRILKNGSQIYSADSPSFGATNGILTIGAYNVSGGGALGTPGGYRNARYGIFWIGLELTNTQMAQLDTAISNFITATGR